MKKRILCWLSLSLLLLSLSAASTKEGEGNKNLISATNQLSLKLLLKEKERSFAREQFALCRARFMEEMRRDPQQTAVRETSQKAMQAWMEEDFRRSYEAEAKKLFALYPGVLSEAEQKKHLKQAVAQNLPGIRKSYPAFYDKVRQELAVEQRQKLIFTTIYPTVGEVESSDDRALAQLLLARLEKSSRQQIMEENLPLVQKQVVSPVIAEARRQQKLQRSLLASLPAPDGLWEKTAIEAQLKSSLETALKQRIGHSTICYPLFPATQKALRERAAMIPAERVARAMETQLNPAHYAELLNADTASHRTPEMSWQKYGELYFGEMRNKAMTECKVPAKVVIDDGVLKKLFQAAVARRFQPVREKFALAQLNGCRPAVTSWQPKMTETEAYAAAVRKTIPQLSGIPAYPGTMLAESEALLQKALKAALEKEADRREEQLKAVGVFYSEVAAECAASQRKRQENSQSFWLRLFGRSAEKLTLPEIVKVYSARIEKEASSPLFPSVVQEIDIRSRAILQQLQEPDPPEEKKSVEMTFRLKQTGKELTLDCGKRQWRFRDGALPAAEIKKAFADVTPGTGMTIKLIVSGDTVYYRTVAELRTLLQECADGATVEDTYQR